MKHPKRSSSKKTITPGKILSLLHRQPMGVKALTVALGLPIQQRALVQAQLSSLKGQGKLMRMRGGKYGSPQPQQTIVGRISQHQPAFAFLIPEKEGQEDLYLPASNLKDAVAGDLVEAMVYRDDRRGGRQRAQVVKVLERGRKTLVGLFRQQRGYGLLAPDGLPYVRDFFIARGQEAGAEDHDVVVAEVRRWPDQAQQGQAKVIDILGKRDDPGVDITTIIKRFELPEGFSLKALAQAKAIAVAPSQTNYPDREDCRHKPIVTIDGADARDFDDAVYCEPVPGGGWQLEVYIADVAHYLKSGTVLDLEARERGTSVYLPDRVLHMLPEELSCGVCSLVPDQDRFTVCAIMTINPQGVCTASRFVRAVIRSAGRLTYDGVETVLSGKEQDDPAQAFKVQLRHLAEVSAALRANRDSRGNLDFDLPDARVILNEKGEVTTIEKRQQLQSHRLIEDCMIAANEAVAAYLARAGRPTLYRIHEAPDGEKMEEFQIFLKAYGYDFSPGKPKEASRAFQALLHSFKGKPEEAIMNHALLRAMKLAVYSAVNKGHFGLGSSCYCHFTSPIRRYPDLIVHRMLTEQLEQGNPSGRHLEDLQSRMPQWAEHLSQRERIAEKAERMAVRTKQMQFLKTKLGEPFEGIITSVKAFGFFVELNEHYVEGLVPVTDLNDDYYLYDETRRFFYGSRSGREYRTGQAVRISVLEVDEEQLRVYFQLLEHQDRAVNPGPPKNPPRLVKSKRRHR